MSLFDLSVSAFGELVRATDPDFHYFALPGMQTDRGDDTFLLSLPIDPARRELLLAISSDLVLPLMDWAEQSVYDILRWVWETDGVLAPAASLHAVALQRLSRSDPVARRLRAAALPRPPPSWARKTT
ncbi:MULTISPECIES: hypothetical protein [unclassified Pseudomonas]|uniref:hypothetical protein n=1 Tax=unclassified Pseudomonas TaxID=196821 RepID=UPI0030DB9ED2